MNEALVLSERVIHSTPSATVGIADQCKTLREQGKKVFDFSAGRAFEPTPDYVVQAAVQALRSGDTHQTKAKGTTAYRVACARKLARENGIEADPEREIVTTMGIKQGMTIAFLALLNPGDEVIVEDPCFVSYQEIIRYTGGKAVAVPLRPENQYRWDIGELESRISGRTKAILLCNPHNPTGVVLTRQELSDIGELARAKDLFVITDEVYERLTWGGRPHVSLAALPGMRERTVTLMSLTKSFAMGGWRIGFAHARPDLIVQFEKLQQHLITSPNSFVQAGGAMAFGEAPREEVSGYWNEWEEKCRYLSGKLNEIAGLRCAMPEGAFYAWTDIRDLGISSVDFSDRLLREKGVAVIPGSSFGAVGEGFVRITCVKSYEEINGGLERIREFINSL